MDSVKLNEGIHYILFVSFVQFLFSIYVYEVYVLIVKFFYSEYVH